MRSACSSMAASLYDDFQTSDSSFIGSSPTSSQKVSLSCSSSVRRPPERASPKPNGIGCPVRRGSKSDQPWQSTATSRAAHTSLIRSLLRAPSRSTSTAIETLSTESRLIAVRWGTGSRPGSRRTSLGRCRTVVVQGAMSERRNLGMAASRERTSTGRRPMSESSHHHSSPRRGVSVTSRLLRCGMTQDRPTRQAR